MQELLNELTSDINYQNEQDKTSSQAIKLICEGKADGFNEELFNLLVVDISVGGKRSDGVADPKALHVHLNHLNLSTDARILVENGGVRYAPHGNMEEDTDKDKLENPLCSFHSNNAR